MSGEWIKTVKAHQADHGCSYKEALQHCSKKQKGEGIGQAIQTVKVLMGFDQLQPIARKTLEEHGNETIKSIVVVREDIKQLPVDTILNVISAKGYDYFRQQYGYDKLKHLYMVITTDKGTNIINEKNERIGIKLGNVRAGGEILNVPVNKTVTVNEFIQNTQKYMGDRFYPYHPSQNNCQFYIRDSLKANGMLKPTHTAFIMQPVDEVLTKLNPKLIPLIKGFTDLGKIKDVLMKGGCKCKQKGGSTEDAQTFRSRINQFLHEQVNLYRQTNTIANENDRDFMRRYILRQLNLNFGNLRQGLELTQAEITEESRIAMVTLNVIIDRPRNINVPKHNIPKPPRSI